jgi:predicted RNase H-like HicB family nuclease
MGQALYDKLEDNSFSGRIPSCPGVLSFAPTLKECEEEPRSTLEDGVLVGLKLRHHLPVIGSIDLNKEAVREPVDSLSTPRVHPPPPCSRFRRAVVGSTPSVFDIA